MISLRLIKHKHKQVTIIVNNPLLMGVRHQIVKQSLKTLEKLAFNPLTLKKVTK